jgi:hypothetical protein
MAGLKEKPLPITIVVIVRSIIAKLEQSNLVLVLRTIL